MPNTKRLRLNFLGVLSLFIGAAAIVQAKHPYIEYKPMLIAGIGIGVGLLGFLLSIVTGRFGSGLAVLGILVSLGAISVVKYDDGTLPGWWAKMHPTPPAPPQVVTHAAPQVIPTQAEQHSNNIFGIPSGPDSDDASKHATAPLNIPPASPAVMAPHPSPEIPQPTVLTVQEARARLATATSALEKSLVLDSSYAKAKADVVDAQANRDATVATDDPGSPSVVQASTRLMLAKKKLQTLIEAAAAKDPSVIAAQRDLKQAEMNDPSSGSHSRK